MHTFVTKVGLRIGGLKNRQEPRVTLRITYEVVGGEAMVKQTEISFAPNRYKPDWYPCTDFWDLIDRSQYEELDKLMLRHAREPIEDFLEESHVAHG